MTLKYWTIIGLVAVSLTIAGVMNVYNRAIALRGT